MRFYTGWSDGVLIIEFLRTHVQSPADGGEGASGGEKIVLRRRKIKTRTFSYLNLADCTQPHPSTHYLRKFYERGAGDNRVETEKIFEPKEFRCPRFGLWPFRPVNFVLFAVRAVRRRRRVNIDVGRSADT